MLKHDKSISIFYGAAIQGAQDRTERASIHSRFIDTIKDLGCEVVSEHARGTSFDESAQFLENSIGPLPPLGIDRTVYVRRKMIAALESDINAAIFEVSTPSLGTGIEIAHAYLRPRLGLPGIGVLCLYEKDYWPNNLSSMIRGITKEECPLFQVEEYDNIEHAQAIISRFIDQIATS